VFHLVDENKTMQVQRMVQTPRVCFPELSSTRLTCSLSTVARNTLRLRDKALAAWHGGGHRCMPQWRLVIFKAFPGTLRARKMLF